MFTSLLVKGIALFRVLLVQLFPAYSSNWVPCSLVTAPVFVFFFFFHQGSETRARPQTCTVGTHKPCIPPRNWLDTQSVFQHFLSTTGGAWKACFIQGLPLVASFKIQTHLHQAVNELFWLNHQCEIWLKRCRGTIIFLDMMTWYQYSWYIVSKLFCSVWCEIRLH